MAKAPVVIKAPGFSSSIPTLKLFPKEIKLDKNN
jgi:hypothetical protein